jgi:transcriptional regulator with XRE-family HTH domain
MAFADNLRRLMQLRGIRAAQLGPRLGVTPSAVRQWLDGKTHPVGRRMADLAEALDVAPDELFAQAAGFSDAAQDFQGHAAPDELHRLPEVVEALAAKLAEDGISLGPRRTTAHAQAALHQASSMNRALPFEERTRFAVEAKAQDIRRRLD